MASLRPPFAVTIISRGIGPRGGIVHHATYFSIGIQAVIDCIFALRRPIPSPGEEF